MVAKASSSQGMTKDGPSWTAGLDKGLRDELKGLHLNKPLYNLKILLLLAIWLIAGFLAVQTSLLIVKLAAWMLIGLTLHALAVFMHEGAHENIFRIRPLDRLVGFLCGLPVFFSCSNYRATHLLHHRYESTDRDPDNLDQTFPGRWSRRIVFYSFLIIGMPLYVLQTTIMGPFRADGWRERSWCLLEIGSMAIGYSWLFLLASRFGYGGMLLDGWICALPVTIILANVRGLSEHTMLEQDPPDPLRITRTTRTNRVMSFFLNNQNHHLEHHLFPRIPWYNLPRLHRLLTPLYARHEASIATGYLKHIADSLRYGPLQALRYGSDGTARPSKSCQ